MAQVTFRSGNPVMADYTNASTDIAAGQVFLQGSVSANTGGTGAIAMVAHRPIANGSIGALAVFGGIYEGTNRNNAAVGTAVWWDDTNDWFTTVSTNNAKFGFVVSNGAGGTNSAVRVFHDPDPT